MYPPIRNTELYVEIREDGDGFHCNMSYEALENSLNQNAVPIKGYYISRISASGLYGAHVHPIVAFGKSRDGSAIIFKYAELTANYPGGQGSGGWGYLYMDNGGQIKTTWP